MKKIAKRAPRGRQKFSKKSKDRSKTVLGRVFTDVCGPMETKSHAGSKYFITFIDDKTRYTAVYFIKHKSEALSKFKEFAAEVENFTGQTIKIIHSDNGGEYISKEFETFCKTKGIKIEDTIPHTPQHNGIAERMNRTLVERATAMLQQSGLPKTFWAEAINTASYIINRSPAAANDVTPFEGWHGYKAEVQHMRVFGCDVMNHIPKHKRKKFDAKSKLCTFVGYNDRCKGYKLYDSQRQKFIKSRDVIFYETKFQFKDRTALKRSITDFDDIDTESDRGTTDTENSDHAAQNPQNETESIREPSTRARRPPNRDPDMVYGDWWDSQDNNGADESAEYAMYLCEPRTYKQAMKSENYHDWETAMNSEYKSLMKNETWDLVEPPVGKNIVGSKWVYKTKRDSHGQVDRYKARLVAQGYTQEFGVDYDEVYAPVAHYKSIRTVLSIANALNLHLHQMDVKTAFLNGPLDTNIYMKQPTGYINPEFPDFVCKLKKSLYGLKQAARCWNTAINSYMTSIGFEQSKVDQCIYVKRNSTEYNEDSFMIICLYVDDLILATNDINMMKCEKEKFGRKFEMEDKGELEFCLGMNIVRDKENLELSINQKHYIEQILDNFEMSDCKPVGTPLENGRKFFKLEANETCVNKQGYQSAIGCLIYLSVATRPDIAVAVNCLSQFMCNPSKDHWTGVKRILRYLKGTVDYALTFKAADADVVLKGFTDADWAGDISTRKSTSGYVFKICGGFISWRSNKQSTVALSTTEAEYIALTSAAQEAVWLRALLKDLGFEQESPTVISEDNQSAIAIAKNYKVTARTKHIDVRYHFIKELIDKYFITILYCPTEEMIADIMTKGLVKQKFDYFRDMLNITSRS